MSQQFKRIKIDDINNPSPPIGGGVWEIEVAADGHYYVQTESPTADALTKRELAELAAKNKEANS